MVLKNATVATDLKSPPELESKWTESSLDFHNPGFLADTSQDQDESEIKIDLPKIDLSIDN